ncbi:MAG: PEP-CTERM sorting domain-containing protein [Planctomycetaceae bacterium]|jgi:hypothetical protein
MRAWYCMLGCLLCVGLAPPARGAVIPTTVTVELDQQITDSPLVGWSPLSPYTSWITASFTNNQPLDDGVEVALQTHLNPGEFVTEIVMAVHVDSSGGLNFFQIPTTGTDPYPPPENDSTDPTVFDIDYDPENIAIQGNSGGSPQGTGYDVRLSWKPSNNQDRYGAAYNDSQVRFLITWNNPLFTGSLFLNTLKQQSNDPNNGDQGLYVMAAHIQGIAPLTPGGEQRSSFIGALDPPPDGTVPEPGTWALGGLGMLGLVWQQVRRQRRGQPV